jgi:2-desacetyl-2-hydroxyethyl bacteriochlorophyllide A dehydrogenase
MLGPRSIPRPGHPHPISGETLPVVLGHEFCGIVVEAAEECQFRKGQAVMVDPRLHCSACRKCSDGNSNACNKMGFIGLSGLGGGLSEFVAVNPRMLHVLPETVPLNIACLIEPLAVAWHAAKIPEINDYKDMPVLILGGGPIGYALLYVLRAKGANIIYVSEPSKARHTALKAIADAVIDPKKEKVAARCHELTSNEGVRVVFDCAGVQPSFNDGVDSLAFRGMFVNVAGWHNPVCSRFTQVFNSVSDHFQMSVSAGQIMFKEPKITGSLAYNESDFAEVVAAFGQGN